MQPIDYEAEYNNRARVPEHPGLIEGWQRDAAAWRAAAKGDWSVPYGDGPRMTLDVVGDGAGPVAMFVHGGYWQALDRSWFSGVAPALLVTSREWRMRARLSSSTRDVKLERVSLARSSRSR